MNKGFGHLKKFSGTIKTQNQCRKEIIQIYSSTHTKPLTCSVFVNAILQDSICRKKNESHVRSLSEV